MQRGDLLWPACVVGVGAVLGIDKCLGRKGNDLIHLAGGAEEERGESAGRGACHDDAIDVRARDNVIEQRLDRLRGIADARDAELIPAPPRVAQKRFLDREIGGDAEKLEDRHADAASDAAEEN
jgi:hypothetical protein